jgi:hypothetical protein
MAHIGNLLVLFGILLGIAGGFIAGWWARGRRKRSVI